MIQRPLRDFELEVHFARWEFAARHHMTASDAETLTVGELLDLAGAHERERLESLRLGYTETWGGTELREAIASTYEKVDPECVLAFAGGEEALFWAMQELVRSGEHAVVTVPNYQSMETIPLAAGADVDGLLLREQDGWAFDLDDLERLLRPNTRLVAVNFPNNPTGALPDAETFAALVGLCEDHGIRLFCDEAYRGLERDPALRLTQAADLSASAISLNVMSKSYGLPGLRIGWLACRDRAILERLERRKHYTSICNSGPNELLAAMALRHGNAIQSRNRSIIAANLPLFDAFFTERAELFDWEQPHGGCVCFPRYKGPDGVERFCRELLEQAGVLVLPASIYRSELCPTPPDRFRVGLGRRNPEPGLAAMAEFLAKRWSS